jgi:tRNA A-37 threonylcarbamoyl transferase component Bud32
MIEAKDTVRATVHIGYDGRVHKVFKGHAARERFDNEVRVLRYLEARGCPFVPKLLESDPEQLKIITSNAGQRVEHLDDAKMNQLFAELEAYGVRHDDQALRNVTYNHRLGRFCLIDFEFATILDAAQETAASPASPPTL